MSKPQTMMIDEVEYIRKDSVKENLDIGDVRIIVADRGWVFVGACTDNADGSVTIKDAKCIRQWGTTKGLGELINGPVSKTVADDYGTVKTTPIAELAVVRGW